MAWILNLLIVSNSIASAAENDNGLEIAKTFLSENKISSGKILRPKNYIALHQRIEESPDPQSKFGYIVFSLARHSKKLLDEAQAVQIRVLIDARRNADVNWHDVRNVVRVHATLAMWRYAAAPSANAEEIAQLRAEWESWTDLRLAYMFEEFVNKEKFQRAAWDILTSEQQQKIRSGEWDQYLKKNKGHKRLFYADKIVSRALGKPEHSAAFKKAVENRRDLWKPMWNQYQSAVLFERKREFSMDITDQKFANAAWSEYAKAFRSFAIAECDSIREVLQSGYNSGPALEEKINQNDEKLRTGMIEKFIPGAGDYLKSLGYLK